MLVGEEICGEGLGCSFGVFACINVHCDVHFHWVEIPFRFFNCISYNRYGSETRIQVICHILVIIDIPVLQLILVRTQSIFHALEPPSLCTNELVVLSLQFLSYY